MNRSRLIDAVLFRTTIADKMSTTVTRNSTTANGGAISTAVASAPVLPRDARLIALLLAANGAEDCEEGVVRMLVEFAHRKSRIAWLSIETPELGVASLEVEADVERSMTYTCWGGNAGYTTDILTDALMYAEHARSGQPNPPVTAATPSLDDVRLAVQARTEGAQVPKEVRGLHKRYPSHVASTSLLIGIFRCVDSSCFNSLRL